MTVRTPSDQPRGIPTACRAWHRECPLTGPSPQASMDATAETVRLLRVSMSRSFCLTKSDVTFREKKRRRKRLLYFPARKIERETVAEKGERVFRQEMSRHLHRSKERFTKCASGGYKKSEPARSAQPMPYKNCTTIVVLPSPRSLFSSIERQLDCRFPSTVGQRNQICRKQTIMTLFQAQSIRQHYPDVNNY